MGFKFSKDTNLYSRGKGEEDGVHNNASASVKQTSPFHCLLHCHLYFQDFAFFCQSNKSLRQKEIFEKIF